MANRKVLINRHSTKNQAPVASEMFHGEIAVSHPSDLSATTIWTLNNNTMVPFASCAMTMQMIDNAITAADVTYDVKAAEGDAHVEVVSGGDEKAKVFTVSSKDVQSKEEFETYSAATKVRIDQNASAITDTLGIISALTNVVVTGITGDGIIIAEIDEHTTGSNTYSVTHKQALAVPTGFNKLATDAYGHVTSATAVVTADIEGLGFKNSADTADEIEAAIEALGAVSASTGKYFTAIGVENGKLVKEEEDLPTLEIESAGTGNVVSQIKVEGHKISYSATSVATSDDIEKLSAATINLSGVVGDFSGATFNEFESAFTTINNLSADTEAADNKVFSSAKTYADELIAALDSATAVTAGKYLTGIAIADGKISGITEADLPELSKVVSGAGNVFTDIEVNDHEIVINKGMTVASDADLQALSGVVGDFSGATDSRINELSGYTEAVDDKVGKLSAATISISGFAHGEIAELSAATSAVSVDVENLSAATLALSAVTITGVSLNNTPLTVTDHVVSIPVTVSGSGIANATDSGSVADAKAVKEYVENLVSSGVNYKGATDSLPATGETGDLYVASSAFTVGSENVEVGDFIIYDGTKWDVIQKNLDGAITGNLTAGTVTLGNGPHTVESLANGSNGQVLGVDNGAVAWVDLPVLSSATTGNGNVVTSILVNDHEITYVKDFTAADNADLNALSAGTIQLSGDVVAYVNQISGYAHNSMIARDDDVFSSAATYADEKVAAEIAKLDSTGVTSDSGHYLTSVTITDGKISAVGEEEIPAAVAVTTASTTTATTASSVVASVVPGGTDGHELTLNMTNKVYSAATADEAVKVKSALTINVLDSAGTTASTVTFDGSSNQTIEIPGSHDTATTEDGHYAPSTTASSLDAAAGTVLNTITLDSKKHVISAGTTDKINSASTAESADTATKVNNALSISGYATSESTAFDSNFSYDGSEAKALAFGKTTAAGKSMSVDANGVVDVEIIDCGEY